MRAFSVGGMFVLVALAGPVSVGAAADVTQCEGRPGKPPQLELEKVYVKKLGPLLSCMTQIDDLTPCNHFAGQALEVLFGNVDFKSSSGYLLANDMFNGLAENATLGWTSLGDASSQAVLDKAQSLANQGKAVVAAKLGLKKPDSTRGPGHIVLILPGQTERYDADTFLWGELKAPNSASFFLDNAKRVYLGCPLSASWRKPEGVRLFSK